MPAHPTPLRPRRLVLVAGMALAMMGLSACSSSSSDLDAWIAKVKEKPSRPLPALPASPQYDQFTYQAHDLRDPFVAFRPEPQAQPGQATGPRPDPDRPREPLEEFALDSLRMVGTIGSGAQRQGLVADPNGVTHRIVVGRHLGMNDGRVVGIGDDRIDIIELVPTGQGSWEAVPTSLVLAQP